MFRALMTSRRFAPLFWCQGHCSAKKRHKPHGSAKTLAIAGVSPHIRCQ